MDIGFEWFKGSVFAAGLAIPALFEFVLAWVHHIGERSQTPGTGRPSTGSGIGAFWGWSPWRRWHMEVCYACLGLALHDYYVRCKLGSCCMAFLVQHGVAKAADDLSPLLMMWSVVVLILLALIVTAINFRAELATNQHRQGHPVRLAEIVRWNGAILLVSPPAFLVAYCVGTF